MPIITTFGAASARGFGCFRPTAGLGTFIAASGGTETTSGNYKYHTFTSSGTLTVTAAPSGRTVDFIVVGAGGDADINAAGGGGGVVVKEAQSIAVGSYAVTVGAGSGADSVFKGVTALGGGGGNSSGVGYSGGCGGGGTSGGGPGLQPTSASGGYGNAGALAGGGGAGTAASGNAGGRGKTDATFGTFGAGGNVDDLASAPPANTGDGGGYNTTTFVANPGASGTVVIRYLYQ